MPRKLPSGRARAWIVGACVAVALVSVTVTASAKPSDANTLTVSATRTGSIPVTLPRVGFEFAATFTSPDVVIVGKGRIIGIALRPAKPADAMPLFVAAQMQSCYRSGCVGRYREQFVSGSLVDGGPGRKVVPAGHYILQAFTDGSPVTVTLHLDGLGHDRFVRPTGPAAFTVESPQSTFAGRGAVTPGVNVAPGHYTVRRPGVEAFVFGQVDWAAAVGGDLSACFYDADVPVVLPECVGGSGVVADGVLVSASARTQLLYADYANSASGGPSSAGFALAHGSAATLVASNVAWLES